MTQLLARAANTASKVAPKVAWQDSGRPSGQSSGYGNASMDGLMDNILSSSSLMPLPLGEDLGEEPNKWSGGVVGKDGCIYGLPRNASQILRFEPKAKSATLVGPDLGNLVGKWSGAVSSKKTGRIYGVPDCAAQVLEFDPLTKSVTLVGDDLGLGSDKWSGGVLGKDDCLYCIPHNASRVLRFNPKTKETTFVGEDLGGGLAKWSGGVLGPDGCIYGIPASATHMLRFDPATETASRVGNSLGRGEYKWSGGVLGKDGYIYGIPSSAVQLLRFDTKTEVATRVGDDLGDGEGKWDGGVIGPDGCIYGIPHNAQKLLRYDARNKVTTLFGDGIGSENAKWSGGVRGIDGCIYGIPCSGTRVLRLDPRRDAVMRVGDDMGVAYQKWVGCVLASDHCIYGVPNCGTQVLKFDPNHLTTTLIGEDLGEGLKWSGAALGADGCIYGIPFDAQQVLRIDPLAEENPVTLVGDDLGPKRCKWSSGVAGPDGCIYGMPRNAAQVLRYDPESRKATLVGDSLGDQEDKWCGGVLAGDGCIYGIPSKAAHILRFDPKTESASLVGESLGDEDCKWAYGVLAPNGCIYAVPRNANQVLRFNPSTQEADCVGDDLRECGSQKWYGAVLSRDGCIYGIPRNATRVLHFDPLALAATLVGEDLGPDNGKWMCGALSTHGHVFGIPSCASQVLRIFTDVAECAVLQCLGKLVRYGARSDAPGLPPDVFERSELLAHGLSSANQCIYREAILHQWQMLCDTALGPQSLASQLMFARHAIGIILNIEDPHTRSEFLQLSGVHEFMRRPESVGGWLEDRIVDDEEKVSVTVQYLELVSDLTEGSLEDRNEVMLAMAKLPRFLANMLKLSDTDEDRLVATKIVRNLIHLKASKPLAVLAHFTEVGLVVSLLCAFLVLTWPLGPADVAAADFEGLEPAAADELRGARQRQERGLAVAVLVIAGSLVLYELVQTLAMRRLGLARIHLVQIQTWMDLTSTAFAGAVACMHLGGVEPKTENMKSIVILSTAMLCCKFLFLLKTLNQNIATFMSSLVLILVDLVPFAIVLFVVMFGFVHSLRVAQVGIEGLEGFGFIGDACFAIMRMTMGDFDPAWFPTTVSWGRALFSLYMAFVVIIMLNVLIAVVSDSWADAKGRAKTLFMRAQLEYAAVLDAMCLTREVERLPACVSRLALAFRQLLMGDTDVEEPGCEVGGKEAGHWEQRALEAEEKVRSLERSSWLKLEAALENTVAKMEVRVAARVLEALAKPTAAPVAAAAPTEPARTAAN